MLILEKYTRGSLKDFLFEIFSRCCRDCGETVLIKPNWGGRIPLIRGENTDALFLKYLTEYLASLNAGKVYVAHQSLLGIEGQDYSFNRILDINGINKVEFPPIVEFLNLGTVERETVIVEGFRFHIPVIVKKVDFYINLSKLKTHMETKASLCIKNQMGLLPSKDKKAMHRDRLEYKIALLAKAVSPDLSIIDGIYSMDKNGPHHGRKRHTNIVIGSDDMLQADSLAAYLIGYEPEDIPHLKFAQEFGAGSVVPEDLKEAYQGERLSNFMRSKEYLRKFKFNIWPTTACSQCIFNLEKVQKYLKRNPLLFSKIVFSKSRNYNIVIGTGENLRDKRLDNIIPVGDCSLKFAGIMKTTGLKGCPPSSKEIFEFIKKFTTAG